MRVFSPEEQHYQETNMQFVGGLNVRMETFVDGARTQPVLNNQFCRFNQNIMDYPAQHEDIDDITLYQVDNFERIKPFKMKDKDTAGLSPAMPLDDNDETLTFYDIQGESLYTNPPLNSNPVIDHGCDEDEVWAFRLSGFNQSALINQYTRQSFWTSRASHVPFWGKKLIAPAFFKEEKLAKYLE